MFRLEDLDGGVWRPTQGATLEEQASDLTTRSDCPVCNGSGYFADPSAADIEEARQAALKGLLGPEIKAAEEAGEKVVVKRGRGGRYSSAR